MGRMSHQNGNMKIHIVLNSLDKNWSHGWTSLSSSITYYILKLLFLLKSDVLPNTAAQYHLLLHSLILCLKLLSLTAFWHLGAYRKSTSSWSQGWKAPASMLRAFQWINPITLRQIFSCILLWRHFRKQLWLLNKSIFLRTETGLNKIHMRSTLAERCVPTG